MRGRIELPAAELRRLRANLGDELTREKRAGVRALNKAATAVASATTRGTAAATGVPARVVRKRVKVRRASVRRIEARVWVGTYAVKVAELGTLHQGKRGARAGRGKIIPGAFVAAMPNGHTGLFKRKGAPRLPIQEQTISLLPAAETVLIAATARGRGIVTREYRRLLARPNRRPRRIRR